MISGADGSRHMARDEMAQITADRWDAEIWGAATATATSISDTSSSKPKPKPKLVFYFGQDDHWVADRYRDELISTRGQTEAGESWKPKMLVDESGVPHAFCVREYIHCFLVSVVVG